MVFVTLGFGPIPTMVLIGVLTFVAVMELFNAMRLAGLRPATLLGLVGATALPAASYVRGDAGFPLVMGLAVVFGMLWYLTGADTERPVLNLGLTFLGILWIGALASFGALMIRAEDGVGLLLATIIVTALPTRSPTSAAVPTARSRSTRRARTRRGKARSPVLSVRCSPVPPSGSPT